MSLFLADTTLINVVILQWNLLDLFFKIVSIFLSLLRIHNVDLLVLLHYSLLNIGQRSNLSFVQLIVISALRTLVRHDQIRLMVVLLTIRYLNARFELSDPMIRN
jgi:hypothetical protein